MILGVGTDIIEVRRIAKALRQQGFAAKVFTPEEIVYCASRKSHAAESYAARFAAKEAVGKALGCGITPDNLLEIQVSVTGKGQPQLVLTGAMAAKAQARGQTRFFLSLSHTAELAIAYVVWEAEK